MELEPRDLYEKLEFDKIIELIEKQCLGELGIEAVRRIKPHTDLAYIEKLLDEVSAYKLTIEKNDRFPISQYHDISEDIKPLEIEGYVLPEEAFKRINTILLLVREIFRFFNGGRQAAYASLYALIRPISFDESLIQAIEKVIDAEGNIKPDASPQLLKIKKEIGNKQRELDKQFRVIITEYRNKGWLTDNVESFRNGRRVLSVPSEHKRKIRGIIHDESTTGKTAFIEPEPIIDINNDIFDLETEERREIYRILKELSAAIRPYAHFIKLYQDILVTFDVIQAKARLAMQINGYKPVLADKPRLGIIRGFHPLLYLKNKNLGRATIPFNLTLLHDNRILVLSGPNAGGKSVTMKSVGLLQLMLQCGLLVSADPNSEMGIFQHLFADIGDQQSLEDDLSTYSSRLANAKVFLEKSDKRTLVLIDEFGSGTDPKIGGAIAEAILKELNNKGVFGVITTHYSNLKIFAFKNRGLVNGSMLFNKENLSPTYELKVGRPGSSYAFEIAEKTNLGQNVLQYARQRIGKNEKAVDELLIDLQREKQEVEDKLRFLTEQQKNLEKLISNYDQLHRDLEYRRKKFKLESKEQALQSSAQQNKELERMIREIREQMNLERAKEVAAKVKEEKQQLVEEVVSLKEAIYHQPETSSTPAKPIKENDFVKLKTGGATGRVLSISKQKAMVQVGDMRMTIHLRDLQHANSPLEVQSGRSIQTDIDQAASFQPKLDIRGMRMEEALRIVEAFVDQALMTGTTNLRILHGKGDGVLRKAVRAKLREYQVDMAIRHPEPELGGDGITLVEIR
ncbi:MAG: endonuclease MutS2 [Saprospiraceae bacterium]|nr:endonuclease MutS2 [Saprospiraceae bacterium]